MLQGRNPKRWHLPTSVHGVTALKNIVTYRLCLATVEFTKLLTTTDTNTVKIMDEHRMPKRVLQMNMSRKRPSGRPRTRWLDQAKRTQKEENDHGRRKKKCRSEQRQVETPWQKSTHESGNDLRNTKTPILNNQLCIIFSKCQISILQSTLL